MSPGFIRGGIILLRYRIYPSLRRKAAKKRVADWQTTQMTELHGYHWLQRPLATTLSTENDAEQRRAFDSPLHYYPSVSVDELGVW